MPNVGCNIGAELVYCTTHILISNNRFYRFITTCDFIIDVGWLHFLANSIHNAEQKSIERQHQEIILTY